MHLRLSVIYLRILTDHYRALLLLAINYLISCRVSGRILDFVFFTIHFVSVYKSRLVRLVLHPSAPHAQTLELTSLVTAYTSTTRQEAPAS